MIRTSQRLRFGCALAAVLLLAGCDTFQDIGDTVGDWFAPSNKTKLKGERIPLNALDDALRPDPALQATAVMLPPPYRNTEWPQPGGFSSNAMYHLEASGHLRQLWDADAGKGSDSESRLTASPVVGGGRIFTEDAEAHVYAFNANTGQEIWDKRLAPKNGTDMPTLWGLLGKPNTIQPVSGMGGGVAYDGGKIFVTSGFGVLICMDGATGRELWRHDMGVPIVNAPVVNGGRIFFPPTTIISIPWRNRRPHPLGSARRGGIRRYIDVDQRRGLGTVRDRALYLGRDLCASGAERPAGLERRAVPFGRGHGFVRAG